MPGSLGDGPAATELGADLDSNPHLSDSRAVSSTTRQLFMSPLSLSGVL